MKRENDIIRTQNLKFEEVNGTRSQVGTLRIDETKLVEIDKAECLQIDNDINRQGGKWRKLTRKVSAPLRFAS